MIGSDSRFGFDKSHHIQFDQFDQGLVLSQVPPIGGQSGQANQDQGNEYLISAFTTPINFKGDINLET